MVLTANQTDRPSTKLECAGSGSFIFQDKIALILRFIPHITQALSAGRPVPPILFQDFIRHRRLDGVLGQTGNKEMVRRFNGIVAMAD